MPPRTHMVWLSADILFFHTPSLHVRAVSLMLFLRADGTRASAHMAPMDRAWRHATPPFLAAGLRIRRWPTLESNFAVLREYVVQLKPRIELTNEQRREWCEKAEQNHRKAAAAGATPVLPSASPAAPQRCNSLPRASRGAARATPLSAPTTSEDSTDVSW
jgi:hypothetical protein